MRVRKSWRHPTRHAPPAAAASAGRLSSFAVARPQLEGPEPRPNAIARLLNSCRQLHQGAHVGSGATKAHEKFTSVTVSLIYFLRQSV